MKLDANLIHICYLLMQWQYCNGYALNDLLINALLNLYRRSSVKYFFSEV